MAQASWGPARLGKSGVHRITRCPSLLSALRRSDLLTLPVFQGVVVSSERFSQSLPALKCSGAGRLATPSGVIRAARSAVSCRSPASGHRASHSKYTRGQSWETGSRSRLFGSVPQKRLDGLLVPSGNHGYIRNLGRFILISMYYYSLFA